MPAPAIRRRPARSWALAMLTGLALLTLPAVAAARPTGQRTVSYHGYRVAVPAGWPVLRVGPGSPTCVRFDRHAVYLGAPGAAQRCSTTAVGRTEAILISPSSAPRVGAGAAAASLLPSRAAPAARSAAQIVNASHHVVVTATWNRDPAVIRRALGIRSWTRAGATFTRRWAPAATHLVTAARTAAATGHAAPAHAASAAGGIYTGLGFDSCSTPSTGAMSAWAASPFRGIGVYIGGTNMACSQSNLSSAWVSHQSAAGWHLMPIYVGLQAPSNSCGCAAISSAAAGAQGTAAANDAITRAESIGLGPGNPIYYDMEGYNRGSGTSATVMRFLGAWTTQLHAAGFTSGVYSSADSGIQDLVAKQGTGYQEPDDIWIANWNGAQNTADSNVPSSDWAAHQRVHQFRGGHNDTYGGVTINIDDDYLDGATAAAGQVTTTTVAAAPSLTVRPEANGAVDVAPRWSGEPGVSSWELLAGPSATALTPAMRPFSVGARLPVVISSAYPYFKVLALGADGQEVGASAAVPTPGHLAVFGNSSFVPSRGFGGVPVGCYGQPSCVVTTTISVGRTTLATSRPERIAPGGGVAYFALSAAAHRLVARAPHHRYPVTVTVRSSTGAAVTRALNLVAFTNRGRGPRRSIASNPSLRIIGATDFVSNGWSGGVLAACQTATPCNATVTLTAGRQVIAASRPQSLGAREVGYLSFTLTAVGHRLLARARGNQLGAQVSIAMGGTAAVGSLVGQPGEVATAQIALSAF